MVIYVESNFILEIALQQEQSSYAISILEFAQQGKITLAVPGFALSEPFATIMHRNGERKEVLNTLIKTFNEIKRSKPHGQSMVHVNPVANILRNIEEREWDGLHEGVGQLLSIGISLPFDAKCWVQALLCREIYGLSSQDAIIYASIVIDLQTRSRDEKKCFLSRDSKAFGQDNDRVMKDELDTYNCRYIGSFAKGFDYIQHILRGTD